VASAQEPLYIIFGNHDGSVVYAGIDSDIRIGVWAVANTEVGFLFEHLASNDSFIVSRNGGTFYYPLTQWDDVDFTRPQPNTPVQSYTNQSILAFCDLGGDPNPFLYTGGDTILIAQFFMRTTDDTSYIYQEICPFFDGGGYYTYSCLFFVDYIAGDANGSGDINVADVTYLMNYFTGFGPPPVPMLAGDANGDCLTNAVDVTYSVAYFKEIGPPPFYGDCY
jgi:hypothetical protein